MKRAMMDAARRTVAARRPHQGRQRPLRARSVTLRRHGRAHHRHRAGRSDGRGELEAAGPAGGARMIVTLTLNPSLDRTIEVDALHPRRGDPGGRRPRRPRRQGRQRLPGAAGQRHRIAVAVLPCGGDGGRAAGSGCWPSEGVDVVTVPVRRRRPGRTSRWSSPDGTRDQDQRAGPHAAPPTRSTGAAGRGPATPAPGAATGWSVRQRCRPASPLDLYGRPRAARSAAGGVRVAVDTTGAGAGRARRRRGPSWSSPTARSWPRPSAAGSTRSATRVEAAEALVAGWAPAPCWRAWARTGRCWSRARRALSRRVSPRSSPAQHGGRRRRAAGRLPRRRARSTGAAGAAPRRSPGVRRRSRYPGSRDAGAGGHRPRRRRRAARSHCRPVIQTVRPPARADHTTALTRANEPKHRRGGTSPMTAIPATGRRPKLQGTAGAGQRPALRRLHGRDGHAKHRRIHRLGPDHRAVHPHRLDAKRNSSPSWSGR